MHKLIYLIVPLVLGILIVSCEKDDPSVIDPILSFPQLLSTSLTPIQFDSDTVDAIATAEVSSQEPVKKVTATVLMPTDERMVFELKDDGVSPDPTANDGFYTGNIFFVKTCRLVGDYSVEFIAENQSGLFSSTDTRYFSVSNTGNLPPVVSNIVITPDSNQSGQKTFFIFMITAVDPNGPCDISKVFYIGFRPNGVPLTTQLELLDDGSCCVLPPFSSTSGDTTANDSKFTRITFGGPTDIGYFRYYLRAIDRSGDTSNVLADSIYIYP